MYLFAPCFIRRIWRREMECTLVQALRLCTGRTAHRGSRGIALPFHDHGTRRRWGVSVTSRPLFTPGKDPVPIVQEAGWAPVSVWTDAENLAPTGIRSPDRPARSQSLYRLCYPAHIRWIWMAPRQLASWSVCYQSNTQISIHANIKHLHHLTTTTYIFIPQSLNCQAFYSPPSFLT